MVINLASMLSSVADSMEEEPEVCMGVKFDVQEESWVLGLGLGFRA